MKTNAMNLNYNTFVLSFEEQSFFEFQYEKYYKKICIYIRSKGMANDQVEQIASNVFFKAIHNMNKFQDRGDSFGSWLYKIASNEVIETYRLLAKNKMEDFTENNTLIEITNEDHELRISNLENSLYKLKTKQLTIIQLRYFEKLSFKEISNLLNISESNAKVRCFRAIENLREIYNSIKE